jgi:SlyX protein
MPAPLNDDRPEQRLVNLELKLTYLEDLCDRLNEVVIRQQGQIDRLMAAVQELSRQAASAEPGGFRSLRDELPPHY